MGSWLRSCATTTSLKFLSAAIIKPSISSSTRDLNCKLLQFSSLKGSVKLPAPQIDLVLGLKSFNMYTSTAIRRTPSQNPNLKPPQIQFMASDIDILNPPFPFQNQGPCWNPTLQAPQSRGCFSGKDLEVQWRLGGDDSQVSVNHQETL